MNTESMKDVLVIKDGQVERFEPEKLNMFSAAKGGVSTMIAACPKCGHIEQIEAAEYYGPLEGEDLSNKQDFSFGLCGYQVSCHECGEQYSVRLKTRGDALVMWESSFHELTCMSEAERVRALSTLLLSPTDDLAKYAMKTVAESHKLQQGRATSMQFTCPHCQKTRTEKLSFSETFYADEFYTRTCCDSLFVVNPVGNSAPELASKADKQVLAQLLLVAPERLNDVLNTWNGLIKAFYCMSSTHFEYLPSHFD
ncbi:hypothetical protein [Vibrio mediterranei]|uniref:hypothetical protein n=1 Tax=Vibrio mediterranei TaxID=689 RepID=UPI004069008C